VPSRIRMHCNTPPKHLNAPPHISGLIVQSRDSMRVAWRGYISFHWERRNPSSRASRAVSLSNPSMANKISKKIILPTFSNDARMKYKPEKGLQESGVSLKKLRTAAVCSKLHSWILLARPLAFLSTLNKVTDRKLKHEIVHVSV
jgi:hypothetical protein